MSETKREIRDAAKMLSKLPDFDEIDRALAVALVRIEELESGLRHIQKTAKADNGGMLIVKPVDWAVSQELPKYCAWVLRDG